MFPLSPRSKVPAVKQWETVATTDPLRLRDWWPFDARRNVGVACGPAGLVVIDLDETRGRLSDTWGPWGVRHGREVLALLARWAGEPDPVNTYTVLTPSVINGSISLSLHCLQRLMTAWICLVDSLLSREVLQRDTTATSFSDREES